MSLYRVDLAWFKKKDELFFLLSYPAMWIKSRLLKRQCHEKKAYAFSLEIYSIAQNYEWIYLNFFCNQRPAKSDSPVWRLTLRCPAHHKVRLPSVEIDSAEWRLTRRCPAHHKVRLPNVEINSVGSCSSRSPTPQSEDWIRLVLPITKSNSMVSMI